MQVINADKLSKSLPMFVNTLEFFKFLGNIKQMKQKM